MRRFSTLTVCLGLATLAALGLAAQAEDRVELETFTFESAFGDQVEAQRGFITVPENRQNPDSRTIRLAFVRFPATGGNPGSPIVYLAGGPGGSGIGTARGTRFPLFMALRAYGDVIAFDQRGTGRSEAELDCTERYMVPFDQPLDRAQAGAIMADGARQCGERLRAAGVDLNGYNSRESADDLDALRQALGAKKLTLWGISYGTHLALATARRHPERIDRMILAGLEGLDHSLKLPSDQQALLEAIAGLAAKDKRVRQHVPDLLASIARISKELEREPATVRLTHPQMGMTVDVVVGRFDLQMGLAGMLRGPSSFSTMPDIVARMEQGDFVPLGLAAAQRRMGQVPDAMALAMDCASGASAAWLARIEREKAGTLLEDAINAPSPEICAGIGVQDLGDAYRAPLRSDIPTLLISGTLDGRTPPENAEEVMAGLTRAEHLIVENAGHSDPLFLSTPRILQAMESFLEGKKLKKKRVSAPAPRFVAPRTVVELDEAALQRFVGKYRIESGGVREVVRAGTLLYTIRDGGRPLPIRPSSSTEFFYEGRDGALTFELGADGQVTRMVMRQSDGAPGEPAVRE